MKTLKNFAATAIIALAALGAKADETPRYHLIEPICDGYLAAGADTTDLFCPTSILLRSDGTEIATLDGNRIDGAGDGFFVAQSEKDGSYTSKIYDSKGHLLGSYNSFVCPLGQARFAISKEDNHGPWNLMNEKGDVLSPVSERTYEPAGEGVLRYSVIKKRGLVYDGLYGLCTLDGKEITPAVYEYIGDIRGGLFPMARGGKSGFLNSKGEEVIAPIYDYNEDWADGGEDPLPMYHYDGKFLVSRDEKWGLVDSADKVIIPFEYYYYSRIGSKGTVYLTREDGSAKVYDCSGRLRHSSFPSIFGDPDAALIPFSKESSDDNESYIYKYGYVDRDGNVVIPAIYDAAWEFDQGKALVKKDGAWHIIDTKGRIVVKNFADHTIGDLVG